MLPFTIEQSPAFGSMSVFTGVYLAPSNQTGSTFVLLRSQDQSYVQRVNINVIRQIVKLAKPTIKCKAPVRGKAACTIRAAVRKLAGGGKGTVVIQRRMRVNGKLIWKTSTSCAAYSGKTTTCYRRLVRGTYRLRTVVRATSLHTSGASAYAFKRI
jgi:hypothetical protein